MNPLQEFQIKEGVQISFAARERFKNFERVYSAIREKENRILNIEEIKKLPFISREHPDFELWKTRRKNIGRFLDYLDKKNKPQKILDIGCGNGFFSHLMGARQHMVTAVDVNLPELEQAARAFGSENPKWYYCDVLVEKLPSAPFDLITFCGSFHYFPDPELILKRCLSLLQEEGEVHIIDSPFYSEKNRIKAREKSKVYFRKMGHENMGEFFFHHNKHFLEKFKHEYKYRPSILKLKFLRQKDSPLPWIKITGGPLHA